MLPENITVGDEVAVMPLRGSPPDHVMDIIKIVFVDERLVRLVDHRAYSRGDRSGLSAKSRGYVEMATEAHREALQKRSPR